STSRRRIASSAGRVLTRLPFRQSPVGRVLTRLLPRYPQHQDQELSRRDGASHLSLLVQRNLAQRKHPPPARPAQRQPFSRLREKVPGGRMRVRAQRAALALLRRRQQPRRADLDPPAAPPTPRGAGLDPPAVPVPATSRSRAFAP